VEMRIWTPVDAGGTVWVGEAEGDWPTVGADGLVAGVVLAVGGVVAVVSVRGVSASADDGADGAARGEGGKGADGWFAGWLAA